MTITKSGTGNAIKGFADRFGITLMSEAQAALSPQLLELHRAILSAFVDTGAAPTTAWITDRASRIGLDPDQALARLARVDLVHTAGGSVTVAYPFSGTPTPHQVQFDDGAAVWAMCAGDAMGISPMTGRSTTITSTDPHTSEPIKIRYQDGNWTWEPNSTLMLVAAATGCATGAEAACRYVHFITSPDNAEAYLQAHPNLVGELYDQPGSIQVGETVFGSLLGR